MIAKESNDDQFYELVVDESRVDRRIANQSFSGPQTSLETP